MDVARNYGTMKRRATNNDEEETLEFYRPYFNSSNLYHKELDEAMEKLERLERVFHRVFDK